MTLWLLLKKLRDSLFIFLLQKKEKKVSFRGEGLQVNKVIIPIVVDVRGQWYLFLFIHSRESTLGFFLNFFLKKKKKNYTTLTFLQFLIYIQR